MATKPEEPGRSSIQFSHPDPNERVRAMVALEEAIIQAMYHGNLEIIEDELNEMRSDPKPGQFASLVQDRLGAPEMLETKSR